MKKLLLNLFIISIIGIGFSFGEGCFHDQIYIVNKPGIITKGANIRNIACMDGSTVIATLKTGTKVRIIGETAWTKIVLPNGTIGRIGNAFVQEDYSRAGVPEFNQNHEIDSYCDTTNINRCPYPVAPGVMPSFYTENQNNLDTPSIKTPTPIPALDDIAQQFLNKIDQQYTEQSKKSAKIKATITALNTLKRRYPKMGSTVDYIVYKIQEK